MTINTPLTGTWQLLPVDTFRQGFYPLEDAAWIEQELPAHWQQHPLFEYYAGKMVYRKHFTHSPAQPNQQQRHWLRINGAFYWSQAYLNGVDLGQHEGYFQPQEHEITNWLEAENTLLIELDCPDERNKFNKRLITGVFSHWDCLDPATNPGGIWLPVELISTGPTRIKEVLLHTERMSEHAAELKFRATLDAAHSGDVTLRWTIAPRNFGGEIQVIDQPRALAQGAQEIAGVLQIRDPQLWWTHDLGHPSCYTVTLAVLQDGVTADELAFTFGIRQFEMKNWIAHLNGQRLFIRGNNYAPGDTRIATMNRETYDYDMQLARNCNLNLLRVHAHVEHPAFYEAANEAGILLWQDFPLQWLYQRTVLHEARRQARQMARHLYNHPAIAIWCMHNEPIFTLDTRDERLITKVRAYCSAFIYSWNRDVMDTQLKQVVEQEDRRRPVVRASGEYAVPLMHRGTDTHFYFGWYTIYGKLRSWETVAKRFPNNVRFVTEFGAQSFPNVESSIRFMDADFEKIDWEHLITRHQFQDNIMEHWLDWRNAGSLENLVRQSQDYQIMINRYYIDRLRYRKYRPTGGIVPFMFHDPNPAVLWSVLDYWRVPKRSYDALRTAFSPQYVFTLLDQDRYPVGEPIQLPIYIVNDAHASIPVELVAYLTGPDGTGLAQIHRPLTLPSDCMAMEAERLRLTPETPGTYRLELALNETGGREIVAHVYEFVVGEE